MTTQADIMNEEIRLSSSLRDAGQELVDRATTLTRALRDATERLVPALEEAVSVETVGDENDLDSPPVIERVERAVSLIEKVARISKTAAETAEKVIKLERQVRGEPTDSISLTSNLQMPQTSQELEAALQAELAALKRDEDRRQH
jgi:hypothetical protein